MTNRKEMIQDTARTLLNRIKQMVDDDYIEGFDVEVSVSGHEHRVKLKSHDDIVVQEVIMKTPDDFDIFLETLKENQYDGYWDRVVMVDKLMETKYVILQR